MNNALALSHRNGPSRQAWSFITLPFACDSEGMGQSGTSTSFMELFEDTLFLQGLLNWSGPLVALWPTRWTVCYRTKSSSIQIPTGGFMWPAVLRVGFISGLSNYESISTALIWLSLHHQPSRPLTGPLALARKVNNYFSSAVASWVVISQNDLNIQLLLKIIFILEIKSEISFLFLKCLHCYDSKQIEAFGICEVNGWHWGALAMKSLLSLLLLLWVNESQELRPWAAVAALLPTLQ